jgi:hypothetical protein
MRPVLLRGLSFCSASTAILRLLHGRTFDRSERTEHTAITRFGTKQCVTTLALVEEDACVYWHHLDRREPTMWARQYGLENHR